MDQSMGPDKDEVGAANGLLTLASACEAHVKVVSPSIATVISAPKLISCPTGMALTLNYQTLQTSDVQGSSSRGEPTETSNSTEITSNRQLSAPHTPKKSSGVTASTPSSVNVQTSATGVNSTHSFNSGADINGVKRSADTMHPSPSPMNSAIPSTENSSSSGLAASAVPNYIDQRVIQPSPHEITSFRSSQASSPFIHHPSNPHVFAMPHPVSSTIPVTLNAMLPIVIGGAVSHSNGQVARGPLPLTQRLLTAPNDALERNVSNPSSPVRVTTSVPEPPAVPAEVPGPSGQRRTRRRRGGGAGRGGRGAASTRGARRPRSGEASSSNDSDGRPARKKKAYIPSYVQEGEKCVVCGDNSTGTHYHAMTCEGCKGFFRRTIQSQSFLTYTCKGDKINPCPITIESRNHCSLCRYRKCIACKMDPNSVLTKEQREDLKDLISSNRSEREKKEAQILTKDEVEIIMNIGGAFKSNSVNEFYVFSEDFTQCLETNDSTNQSPDVISPSVQHAMDFIKAIPGVNEIPANVFLTLMHDHLIDVLGLRMAEIFDQEKKALMFSNREFTEADLVQFPRMERIFGFAKKYAAFVHPEGVILGCLAAIRFLSTDNIEVESEEIVDSVLKRINHVFLKYLQQEKIPKVHLMFMSLANFENIRVNDGLLLSHVSMMYSYKPAVNALLIANAKAAGPCGSNGPCGLGSSHSHHVLVCQDPRFTNGKSESPQIPAAIAKCTSLSNSMTPNVPIGSCTETKKLTSLSSTSVNSHTTDGSFNGNKALKIEDSPWLKSSPKTSPMPSTNTIVKLPKELTHSLTHEAWFSVPTTAGARKDLNLVKNGAVAETTAIVNPDNRHAQYVALASSSHSDVKKEVPVDGQYNNSLRINTNAHMRSNVSASHSRQGILARNGASEYERVQNLSSVTNGDQSRLFQRKEEERIGQPQVAIPSNGLIHAILERQQLSHVAYSPRHSDPGSGFKNGHLNGIVTARSSDAVESATCNTNGSENGNSHIASREIRRAAEDRYPPASFVINRINGHDVPPTTPRRSPSETIFPLPHETIILPSDQQQTECFKALTNGITNQIQAQQDLDRRESFSELEAQQRRRESLRELETRQINDLASSRNARPLNHAERASSEMKKALEERNGDILDKHLVKALLEKNLFLEKTVQELTKNPRADVPEFCREEKDYGRDVNADLRARLQKSYNVDLAAPSLFPPGSSSQDHHLSNVRVASVHNGLNHANHVLRHMVEQSLSPSLSEREMINHIRNIYSPHPPSPFAIDRYNTSPPSRPHPSKNQYSTHPISNNSIIKALQGPPQYRSYVDDGRHTIASTRTINEHSLSGSGTSALELKQEELDAALSLSSFGRGRGVPFTGAEIRTNLPTSFNYYDNEHAQDLTIGPNRRKQSSQDSLSSHDLRSSSSHYRTNHSAMLDKDRPQPHRRTSSFSGVMDESPFKRHNPGPPSFPSELGSWSNPATSNIADSSIGHRSSFSPQASSMSSDDANFLPTSAFSPEFTRRGSFSSSTPSPSGNGSAHGNIKKRWMSRHSTSSHADSNGSNDGQRQ